MMNRTTEPENENGNNVEVASKHINGGERSHDWMSQTFTHPNISERQSENFG